MTAASSTEPSERDRRRLVERAERLARPRAGPDPTVEPAVLIVTVAGQRLSVPARDVAEVLPPAPLTPLPGGGRLVGIRNVRGQMVPVADLGDLLGMGSPVPHDQRATLVVATGDEALGVLVDGAELGPSRHREPLGPPPVDLAAGSPVVGVHPDGTLALEARRLLAHPDLWAVPPHDHEGAS